MNGVAVGICASDSYCRSVPYRPHDVVLANQVSHGRRKSLISVMQRTRSVRHHSEGLSSGVLLSDTKQGSKGERSESSGVLLGDTKQGSKGERSESFGVLTSGARQGSWNCVPRCAAYR